MEAATVRGDLLTVGASFNTKPKHARQQRKGIWTSGQGGHLYGQRVQVRREAPLHKLLICKVAPFLRHVSQGLIKWLVVTLPYPVWREQDVRRRFCKYCPSDIKVLTGEIVRFTNRPLFVITKYLNEAPF